MFCNLFKKSFELRQDMFIYKVCFNNKNIQSALHKSLRQIAKETHHKSTCKQDKRQSLKNQENRK